MKLHRYHVEEGTTVVCESAAIAEAVCGGTVCGNLNCGAPWQPDDDGRCSYCGEHEPRDCGASWLAGHAPDTCPYCGESTFTETEGEQPEAFLAEQATGQAQYARDLRGIIRALWNGTLDFNQAFELYDSTVSLGLTSAWNQAAQEVGIAPADLSPEERAELRSVIFNERNRIAGFLLDVERNSKAAGEKLAPHLARVELWALRWPDVQNRARMMAASDPKLRWTINVDRVVKDNCATCLRLEGKVKRASTWRRLDIKPKHPPNSSLICRGWQCACAILPTDEPMSKGPLPRVP